MKDNKAVQAAEVTFLLEYGRRRINFCADTFQNLAQIFEGSAADRQDQEKWERSACFLAHKMSEGRQMFAANLREMAGMMKDAAQERVQFITLGSRKQKKIAKGLAGEGLTAGEVYLIRRQNGRLELSVPLKCRSDVTQTVADAADYLSVLLDMRLMSSRRNPFFIGPETTNYYFEEEPAFSAMTGTARAVKETEAVTGDNFAFFEADDGNLTVVLSDGMGSGEKACKDSAIITDIAQGLLETGVPLDMVFQMINSAAAGQSAEDNMSTLDLCSMDLYEGSCRFLKAGAAASFIKRGETVEKIPCMTLPLGVVTDPLAPAIEYPLMDGDYIIMLSDGMLEGWPDQDGEFMIHNYLSHMDALSPNEVAGALMRYTIEQCRGRVRDDMTVLATGIWENRDS